MNVFARNSVYFLTIILLLSKPINSKEFSRANLIFGTEISLPDRVKFAGDIEVHNKNENVDDARFRYRFRYFDFLVLLNNGRFNGISIDLLVPFLGCSMAYNGGEKYFINPILLLLNGSVEARMASGHYIEVTSALHPFFFRPNVGVVYENQLGYFYGRKKRFHIGVFSMVDNFKETNLRFGIYSEFSILELI